MKSNIKKGIAFSKNPIFLSSDLSVDNVNALTGVPFNVTAPGMAKPYTGRFNPPFSANVADIVDAYAVGIDEPRAGALAVNGVVEIEDVEGLSSRMVNVDISENNLDDWQCMVIAGGVSRQNFRRYAQAGTDAFEARFLNPKGNFFLTTRTGGWRIVMKETEISPLYFVSLDEALYLAVEEKASGKDKYIRQFGAFGKGIYALDVEAVRKQFFESEGILANCFDVLRGNPPQFSCRIVIERAEPVKNRFRVKFRNSLGCFEVVDLSGQLSVAPDYSDSEDATFDRYDAVTDDFVTERNRIPRKLALSIETDFMRPGAVGFLMDMLGSDEVYLLDYSDLPVRVIPSTESLDYDFRPESPRKFTVKLQLCEDESNIMPDIVDGSDSSKPRVFSKQFSQQFN